MSKHAIFKALIPISLTLLGIEIGSRIVAYQPISTSWREIHPNGVLTNINSNTALHEYWGIGIKKYAFGEYGNRISLKTFKKEFINNKNTQDKCSYLVLGDSLSFGWLVEYENAFPSIIEKKLSKYRSGTHKIEFINVAAGGWGLADYHGYLEAYKKELKKLFLKGIIVFINSDDGYRATKSNLYSISSNDKLPSLIRTNRMFYSKKGKILRFLNNPFIYHIYSFSQKYSNMARLMKNILLNRTIKLDPRKGKFQQNSKKLSLGEGSFKRNIKKEEKMKINRSISDLKEQSSKFSPLFMVYTGTVPKEELKASNRYIFSEEFMANIKSQGIIYDISNIPEKKLLTSDQRIKYDLHPNALGHKLIADRILDSKAKNTLRSFVELTCPENFIKRED